MPKSVPIPRDTRNLIDALRRHLTLLREYSHRAFVLGDQSLCGEVAGKLRVLVHRSRTSRPLLLSLIEHFGWDIPITINDPFGNFQLTLDEYLDSLACTIRTPSQGLVEISNRNLLAMWAQQYGASHEDWELDEEFATVLALSSQLEIGGLPAASAALRAISNTVLWVGEEFLRRVDSQEQQEETDNNP